MDKEKDAVVTIKCSIKQALIISECLDFKSRLYAGQTEVISEFYDLHRWGKISEKSRDVLRHLCKLIKYVCYPELDENSYYGIYQRDKITEQPQKMFDMHQVIRHDISWYLHPKGGITVNFDKPMFTSTDKPIEITIEEKK